MSSVVLAAAFVAFVGYGLYLLLKRRPLKKKGKIIPAIEEVLLNPEAIQVNLHAIHTPPISGYPLRVLSYLYYTLLGRWFLSRSVLSQSNLDLFADLVITEQPTLNYSPPPPSTSSKAADNKSVLLSLFDSGLRREALNCVPDIYAAYKAGSVTPLDVADKVLAAIEESNGRDPPLRAIIAYDRASVLSMAKASTVRWKEGSQLSLLDGIPISIKEDLNTDTYPCACGTTFIPDFMKHLPESNLVKRLCDAGAVIIGVTNMPEFGTNSVGSSENLVHEQPRNPFNTDFFSGGSSSGSAVSVASGLCPISIGGDGGGSGRVPAAVCGAFALKLTHNRLQNSGYLSMFSFTTVSPIANSPLDIAIVLDTLCNCNSPGKASVPLDLNCLRAVGRNLSGVTFGVYWDWVNTADKDIVAIFREAIEKITSLGAVVKDIKIPELEEIRVAHVITAVSELASAIGVDVDKHFDCLGPGSLLVAAMGHHFSAVECVNAMKQRTRTITALEAVFKEVDVIITPTTGCPVPRITPEYLTPHGKVDGEAIGNLEIFTYLANFTGVPAITVPIGIGDQQTGLPAGLQLIASWHQEPLLIKLALSIKSSGLFPALKPKVSYSVL